ncbi:hypothetical protein [Sulfitobacter sp.]|uniref:hypothetical protein n=1 Tax=Sulfitobacter sp. TaxID=1903071 RepID=UPI0030027450
MTETERMTTAILRLERRKTKALTDSISATARSQLLTASEMLAKHLRNAPAGTKVRDLIAEKEWTVPKSETYLPDTEYNELLDALTALDRDPAHPHPLRDRIIEVLGEIGGVWPESACCEKAAA